MKKMPKSNRHNLNPETIQELQESLYDWQTYNFGEQVSELTLLGIYEEAGELCHAHLKMEQGIRGTPESLEAEMIDAIGDIMVYTINFLSGLGKPVTIFRCPETVKPTTDVTIIRGAVGSVFRSAGKIESHDANVTSKIDHMVISLANLCALKGWSLEKIVRDTWSTVGKRDWKKYPETGVLNG